MVKINYLKDEPYILAALGVKISQSSFEKNIEELYRECKENKGEAKKIVNSIIKNHHHNILLDFSPFVITVDEISRFAALYLWRNINALNLIPGAGIEASFRVIKPIKYNKVVSNFWKVSFELYNEFVEKEIPPQDARYIILEGALTRIIFAIQPRYLLKLYNILNNSPIEELREIGKGFKKVVRESGFETDIEEIPASFWEIWDEKVKNNENEFALNYLEKTKTVSLNYTNYNIKGSLSMYAQLVRERQFLCNIEPMERIAKKARFVIPNSFSNKIKEEYIKFAKTANEKQIKLIEKKDPNFVYFLLLGQEAECDLKCTWSGIIESSKKRCCGVAQWEIRSNVAIPITAELSKYPELKNKIGPRCWRENRCIEPATFKTKKNKCPVFEKYAGKKPKNFEEVLKLLNKPGSTIKI